MQSDVGPIAGASVITAAIDPVLPAYAAIGLEPVSIEPGWGQLPPVLAAKAERRVYLAGPSGRSWLQLVEVPGAEIVDRYRHGGWFSLEVGSIDGAALASELAGNPGFEILSGPAPLEVSEHIVALQAIGPAGELYYFTEVRRELPPFSLPRPRYRLDELFIAVTLTADRSAALAFWREHSGVDGLAIETRIGVLNRGLGLAGYTRLPVGIVQLAGANLIEIDQVPVLAPRPALATGIAMISLEAGRSGHVQGAD
ncbi:MAG: hypothetical protein LAT56_12085, partial [Wenzhouxiangella sp.]|nr:hypothetical protein [Wenzhouxiangella sp.]